MLFDRHSCFKLFYRCNNAVSFLSKIYAVFLGVVLSFCVYGKNDSQSFYYREIMRDYEKLLGVADMNRDDIISYHELYSNCFEIERKNLKYYCILMLENFHALADKNSEGIQWVSLYLASVNEIKINEKDLLQKSRLDYASNNFIVSIHHGLKHGLLSIFFVSTFIGYTVFVFVFVFDLYFDPYKMYPAYFSAIFFEAFLEEVIQVYFIESILTFLMTAQASESNISVKFNWIVMPNPAMEASDYSDPEENFGRSSLREFISEENSWHDVGIIFMVLSDLKKMVAKDMGAPLVLSATLFGLLHLIGEDTSYLHAVSLMLYFLSSHSLKKEHGFWSGVSSHITFNLVAFPLLYLLRWLRK